MRDIDSPLRASSWEIWKKARYVPVQVQWPTHREHQLNWLQAHAKIILENDVVECSILFREIADAFFEQRLFEDALQVYEKLATDVNVSFVCFETHPRHMNLRLSDE